MPNDANASRLDALRDWVAIRHDLPVSQVRLALAAGDASFRRYFRLWLPDGTTRILMDAPPEHEDSRPFVAIARDWRDAGLPVPALHAQDLDAGFIELEDLGDTPMHLLLCDEDSKAALTWQGHALALIDTLQNQAPVGSLPAYDEALLGRELDLFPEWCLTRFLAIDPPPNWQRHRQRLIETALSQPRVAVHRDFDAMNLMVHGERLWLLDFQDAVDGPLSYDMISLLRGRYWRFPRARFATWVEDFRQRAIADGRLPEHVDHDTFLHMADAMAAQRSLKVLGIFCRLTLRDAKQGYLERLPRFFEHLRDSLAPWPDYAGLVDWLDNTFAPALTQALAQHARREGQS
ncbi:phosphotransferase [Halomonas sp. McH1-25]|uniref:aminoglycoside phosphotransferase family protein n=1 Tax=unclassified Halomonas TaxID=2609666 RepID=UPI001EF67F83|nr:MULTISPECIES: phosphotransferase [unclassified Halomonas]MCG7600648.1 phosphotransferase [Halomonas sp. McH1-25]MCP1341226.1 phosphotransferase [Halomonas sp. FL8]MCP1362910.1 phosphotransferase [Halomonas sp. BBD45]MCP1365756.1 phosphotransferase [Halomonas sp. BBD48]